MLLSRVADALYWISRYLERAEHTARLMDVRLDLGLDRRPSGDGWDFERLFAALRLAPPAGRAEQSRAPSSITLVFDLDYPDSVLACVTAARENARQVREEINSDMWEQLNALFLRLRQARDRGHLVDAAALHLPHGDRGRAPLRRRDRRDDVARRRLAVPAGRTLSRARRVRRRRSSISTSATRCGCRRTMREWVGLLRSCAALEAYCRCYTAQLRPELIAEFLLLNPDFPRSVRFSACASRVGAARRGASLPAERAVAAPNASPAACTRRSTTARSTRSSTRIRTPISKPSAATARRSMPRRTKATSRTRSSRRCRRESSRHG